MLFELGRCTCVSHCCVHEQFHSVMRETLDDRFSNSYQISYYFLQVFYFQSDMNLDDISLVLAHCICHLVILF